MISNKLVTKSSAPPFHPWCRSVTVPYFDDEWGRSGERIARGEDGKTYYIPADMTYKEWKKKFVDDTIVSQNVYSDRDKEQYERYKKVLKEVAPKNLESFIDVKYNKNDEWEQLKYQYRTVNRYDIDGDVPIDVVLNLDNAAWYTKQTGFDNNMFKDDKEMRKNIKKLSNSGNAAAMLFDGETYFSHSRLDVDGTPELKAYVGKYKPVPLQNVRRFGVLDLKDGISRETDTEAKFFEYVATKKKPTDTFSITILSEKHICKSCEYVRKQFLKNYPNATVNIISGKMGYNGSELGLRTWKYRKKVPRK